jgi:hypothetical protein
MMQRMSALMLAPDHEAIPTPPLRPAFRTAPVGETPAVTVRQPSAAGSNAHPAAAASAHVCGVCNKTFARRQLVPADGVRDNIAAFISRDHPGWSREGYVCIDDLARYRAEYVRSLLASEKGELTSLEEEVLSSLKHHDMVATNVDAEFEQRWTVGERLADRIASFGGSWVFLICFGLFLATWIAVNSYVVWRRPPDPYPFILLNLILSRSAAIEFGQQIQLQLLNFHQSFPLMGEQMVDLLVQVPDFQFRLEIDLIIVLRAQAVFGLLAVLAHHDDRRLNRSQAGWRSHGKSYRLRNS